MTKEEAKQKYNRVATDKSQLQGFVYDLIDGLIPGAGGGGDFDFATDEDIDLAFGIADIGERTITSHALILNDNDTVDVENHMLILGADGPSPVSGVELDISEFNIEIPDNYYDIQEYADCSPFLDCFSLEDDIIVINESNIPEVELTFTFDGQTYTVTLSEHEVYTDDAEVFYTFVTFGDGTYMIGLSIGADINDNNELILDWVEVCVQNAD